MKGVADVIFENGEDATIALNKFNSKIKKKQN